MFFFCETNCERYPMDHSSSLQQCFTIRLHKNWWPWFMMSGCVAVANWDKGNVFSFLFRSEILKHQSEIVDNSISDFAPWSVFTRACCLPLLLSGIEIGPMEGRSSSNSCPSFTSMHVLSPLSSTVKIVNCGTLEKQDDHWSLTNHQSSCNVDVSRNGEELIS